MGSTAIANVPSVVVKDTFSQQEVLGRRCRWINRIQEFNIEIQISKLVKGQGLAKLMAQSNLDANKINMAIDDLRSYLCDMDDYDQYANVIHYLQHMGGPPHLTKNEKRNTKLQAIRYIIIQGSL